MLGKRKNWAYPTMHSAYMLSWINFSQWMQHGQRFYDVQDESRQFALYCSLMHYLWRTQSELKNLPVLPPPPQEREMSYGSPLSVQSPDSCFSHTTSFSVVLMALINWFMFHALNTLSGVDYVCVTFIIIIWGFLFFSAPSKPTW